MPAVYSALDLLVSASLGEGFSNVIGEAMACAVPCVVTDVGDSAWLVGDAGRVVPAKDPEALAGAIAGLLSEDRAALGARARARIVENFSEAALVARTEALLKDWIG
jgi:glycosyltransferase involved in cell wall biosynthesis